MNFGNAVEHAPLQNKRFGWRVVETQLPEYLKCQSRRKVQTIRDKTASSVGVYQAASAMRISTGILCARQRQNALHRKQKHKYQTCESQLLSPPRVRGKRPLLPNKLICTGQQLRAATVAKLKSIMTGNGQWTLRNTPHANMLASERGRPRGAKTRQHDVSQVIGKTLWLGLCTCWMNNKHQVPSWTPDRTDAQFDYLPTKHSDPANIIATCDVKNATWRTFWRHKCFFDTPRNQSKSNRTKEDSNSNNKSQGVGQEVLWTRCTKFS